jgi:serine/threonine protein kinase
MEAFESKSFGRWRTVRPLGSGGQGTVYLATDGSKLDIHVLRSKVIESVRGVSGPVSRSESEPKADLLIDMILRHGGRIEAPEDSGAVKILHPAADGQDYKKQLDRMKREIKALRSMSHPNVVRILDDELESRWFAMEYFPQGPLSAHLDAHAGRLLEVLTMFRSLVAGVAELHSKGLVHRDIKPENVFFSEQRGLVLSDFGIVYFSDDHNTRVTSTLENVGSRDWMPIWAHGVLIDEVTPSFDVFSLGKLFWAMLSGKPKLLAWYHRKPKFDLEKQFPKDEQMQWANKILDRCVVEEEEQCLRNAGELLRLLDETEAAVRIGGKALTGAPLRCEVCGEGKYEDVPSSARDFFNFGFQNQSAQAESRFKVLRCSNCGHCQLFMFRDGVTPPAWKERAAK